jgi:aminomethyltransferase
MIHLLTTAPPDYQAALDGAALYDEAGAGRIFMRGRDRADLLHRLSTGDILRLRPGQGARSVLTTPIGRIIDLLAVHALEDALLIVASPGQGPAVFGHLKKNIFFNDQVVLEPAGRTYGQLALFGPAAGALLGQAAGAALDDLPPHHIAPIELSGAQALVAGRPPLGGPSFTLYIPTGALDMVRAALLAAGAVPLSAESFDILRIERGYGAFGHELGQEYIPLETGLLDAVSFTKGCYVGQEIIARMESRNRLAKQLRGLRLTTDDRRPTSEDRGLRIEDSNVGADESRSSILDPRSSVDSSVVGGRWPALSGSEGSVVVPGKLEVGGKEAGDLTSVAVSPRFGPIALAYVRSAHAEPGSVVGIAGTELSGEVVELPFDRAGS